MGEVEGRERIHRLESRMVRGHGVRKDGKWGKWRIRKEGRGIGVGVTIRVSIYQLLVCWS